MRGIRWAEFSGRSSLFSLTLTATSSTVQATLPLNLSSRKAYSIWQRRSTSAVCRKTEQLWLTKKTEVLQLS